MTKGLTDKQEQILNYVVEYVEDQGYPPSIREIGSKFKISSLRGVTVHLDALERKGFIKRANTSRSITVIGRTGSSSPQKTAAFLPLVGTIAAGIPITATENVESMIPVPAEMMRNVQGGFALRVKGESMIDAHIMNNDYVIIKPQVTASNGEIIAAMIDGEATVKTFELRNGKARLLPANELFEPIDFNTADSSIIGKVIGVIRTYN